MIIRKGIKKDIPQVLDLIKELAKYENSIEKVSNTVERIENDGFGETPIFDLFVAENSKKIIGIAITYYKYSTWRGRKLYLEDLMISENYRRKGIGGKLFDFVINFAKEKKCTGLNLQVLDWNTIGINFYKKYNMKFDNKWTNYYLEFDKS